MLQREAHRTTGGDLMSIWSTDLGYDESWPEWFLEYRQAFDTEMRAKIAAHQRGEMTERDYTAWIWESVERETRWRESLRPEQRAWLEEQEEADRTRFVPGNPEQDTVDMDELQALMAADPTCSPVRAYLKLKLQPARESGRDTPPRRRH